MEPYYLMISTQRCGTTLMEKVLNSHSQLAMTEEVHWLPFLIDGGRWYQRFFELGYHYDGPLRIESKWIEGVKALHQTLFSDIISKKWGMQIIGQNNSAIAEELLSVFDKVKVIFLIRDPRDLYLSSIRTGIGGRLSGRTLLEFQRSIVRTGHENMAIRYEDFVTQPRQMCEQICNFLDVEFERGMLQPFTQKISKNQIPALKKFDSDYPVGDPSNVGRWKEQLLDEELFLMTSETKVIEELGYPVFNCRCAKINCSSNQSVSGELIGMSDSLTGKTRFETQLPDRVDMYSSGIVGIKLETPVTSFNVSIETYGLLKPFSLNHKMLISSVQDEKYRMTILDSKDNRTASLRKIISLICSVERPKVFLYSAGGATRMFIKNHFDNILSKIDVLGIIDTYIHNGDFDVEGKTWPLMSLTEALQKEYDCILITTQIFFSEIKDILDSKGLRENENYILAPFVNEREVIEGVYNGFNIGKN